MFQRCRIISLLFIWYRTLIIGTEAFTRGDSLQKVMFYSDSDCFNSKQGKKLIIYDKKRLKGSFLLCYYTCVNNQSNALLLGPPMRTVTGCWGGFRILNTKFVYLYQTNSVNIVYGITKTANSAHRWSWKRIHPSVHQCPVPESGSLVHPRTLVTHTLTSSGGLESPANLVWAFPG